MRQRSLDEMITYFNQEIDKMDIDRKYKIALLGMVTAIGCTAKQTIEERKTGKWIKRGSWYCCSECGAEMFFTGVYDENQHYCYNCGADMRGENDGKQPDMA